MLGRGLRAVIPIVLILAWLAGAAIGGPYFGRIDEVSTNDQTSFLPATSESTVVQESLGDFTDSSAIPAVVVFDRDGGLTDDDRAFAADIAESLGDFEGVVDGASPAIESDDGEAFQVFVPISSEGSADIIDAIRVYLETQTPDGLTHFVTGPAGFTADIGAAFSGIDGILLLVALGAVLLILLVVYRSPLLPFLVLGTSLFALSVSILLVWQLARAEVVTLNGQVQGILFILVIGAATDYSLLYVSRYREALETVESRWDATVLAFKGSLEPVLASGGTVIAGLLCLLLSDLNSNKALGPVAAIGVALSMLASLTLLPALLLVAGRASFWPFRPRFDATLALSSISPTTRPRRARGVWGGISRLIAARARAVWVVATLLLLVASIGVLQLRADGVAQSDLVLGQSEARDGQEVLGEHFPGGSGSPAFILGSADSIDDLADAALDVSGVDSVVAVSDDSPSGTVAAGSDAAVGPAGGPPGEPTVVDGTVLLQATLAVAPDSTEADRAVLDLRDAVRSVDDGALVGGVTATAVDTDRTAIHDRTLIIPIVLVVILLILMLLLRSILAPVLLIASVVLSFGAALGVSALVFNGVLGLPGADPSVPLFAFVFLVALGIDYNIFLMTRVREESLRLGTREGVLRGLSVTGGVITSAGIVLAATFAALSVIPILFLLQIAFIVAFGVLLDTLLVRSLLVPALAYDIGPRIWWPSALLRANDRARSPEETRS
ncbi:MMPL family transporter [Marisediminicola sp. LYQ134]|uniref:MMPL family transporter n=1 Tax=Marisediminicola sp. LYQ134 TaxID=3391061 RepID=UPI003982FC1E